MTTAVSRDFRENLNEMTIPPAGVNKYEYDAQQNANVSAITRAIDNKTQLQGPQPLGPVNNQISNPDPDPVGSANLVGNNLTDKGQQFKVTSDMSYLFGSICSSVEEGLNSKSKNDNNVSLDDNQPKRPAPAPVQAFQPSMSGGMGGM